MAVVTGAGNGIGPATTKALAGEGAHVVAGSLTTGCLDGLNGATPVTIGLSVPDRPAQLIRRASSDRQREVRTEWIPIRQNFCKRRRSHGARDR